MRTITMHNLAILALQQDDAAVQVRGFSDAMHKLIRDYVAWYAARHAALYRAEDCAAERTELNELFHRARIHPDAYTVTFVENDCPIVTLYEVEDTSEITVKKMHGLCALWWFLDAIEGDLRVIVLDRYGQNRRELDVRKWENNYWRATKADRRPQPA
jgi:hypothetical protein